VGEVSPQSYGKKGEFDGNRKVEKRAEEGDDTQPKKGSKSVDLHSRIISKPTVAVV